MHYLLEMTEQEVVGPLVSLEQPEQSGAMGQVREQRVKVLGQPAIESRVAQTLNGPNVIGADGDQFARPQRSLSMFWDILHLVIYILQTTRR